MLGEVNPKKNGNFQSGNLYLIQSQNISVSISKVIFNNIPKNFNHLKLIGLARNTSGASQNSYINLNNIVTGYDGQHLVYSNTSLTSGAQANDTFWYGPIISSTSNLSPGIIYIDFPFYSSSIIYKTYNGYGGGNAQSSATTFIGNYWGSVRTTSPVTSISFQSSSGSIAIYSIFNLYGVY